MEKHINHPKLSTKICFCLNPPQIDEPDPKLQEMLCMILLRCLHITGDGNVPFINVDDVINPSASPTRSAS
jgi:hypothetical protein